MLHLLLACAPPDPVDLVIDLSDFADETPGATFTADLVRDEVSLLHIEHTVGEDDVLVFPDALDPLLVYGVVAFLDKNDDGVCQAFPDDYPWFFWYDPGVDLDFVWVPDEEESPGMWQACGWFGNPIDPSTLVD